MSERLNIKTCRRTKYLRKHFYGGIFAVKKNILVSAVALALCSVLCGGLVAPVSAENTAPIAENFEFETY